MEFDLELDASFEALPELPPEMRINLSVVGPALAAEPAAPVRVAPPSLCMTQIKLFGGGRYTLLSFPHRHLHAEHPSQRHRPAQRRWWDALHYSQPSCDTLASGIRRPERHCACAGVIPRSRARVPSNRGRQGLQTRQRVSPPHHRLDPKKVSISCAPL
jgi:hypothetical protein